MKILPIIITTLLISSAAICQAQAKGIKGANGKWALADAGGKLLTPFIYTNDLFTIQEGRAAVYIGKTSGYIDTTGKVIIPLMYNECGKFNYGTALVWKGGKCGLIDLNGKLILPIGKYEYVYNDWDPAVLCVSNYEISKAGKKTDLLRFGLLSHSGEVILPFGYEEIRAPMEGAMKTVKSGKAGFYIPATGLVIPETFDEVETFREGLAAVAVNKKWGFINKKGKMVYPLYYDSVTPFRNGVAYARLGGASQKLVKGDDE